ncbi:MAG: hypothetical protein QOE90_923 [Thermoplasmata archaeon]|nr:hypothetical protein [Thermoplasmata archaeon]
MVALLGIGVVALVVWLIFGSRGQGGASAGFASGDLSAAGTMDPTDPGPAQSSSAPGAPVRYDAGQTWQLAPADLASPIVSQTPAGPPGSGFLNLANGSSIYTGPPSALYVPPNSPLNGPVGPPAPAAKAQPLASGLFFVPAPSVAAAHVAQQNEGAFVGPVAPVHAPATMAAPASAHAAGAVVAPRQTPKGIRLVGR